MSNLHIIVYDANDTTRRRAVNALNQAGIHPEDAWLDPRTVDDIHTAQAAPSDATAPSRDAFGIVIGVGIAATFGTLAVWAGTLGGWWLAAALPASLAAFFGIAGTAVSAKKIPRNDKGNRV